MKFSYYFICLISSLVYAAKWTEVEAVPSISYDYGVADVQGIVHFAFCKNGKNGGVVYLRRKADGTIEGRTEIPYNGMCRAAQISVEKSRIRIAFQIVEFCGTTAYACSNIYFTESLDNGKQWTNVVSVEPRDTNVVYRYNPLIVHNPADGQAWVAFKSLGKENPTTIKVGKKPAGSSNFEQTVPVAKTNQSTIIPGGFGFIRIPSTSLLGLVWEVKDTGSSYDHDIHFSSSASGTTWEPSKIIARTNLYDQTSPIALANDDAKIYLVYIKTNGANKGIWFKESSDNGKTWSSEIRITKMEEYVSVTAKVCTINNENRLYIFAQDQFLHKSVHTFGYMSLKSKKMNLIGNPYKGEIDDCFSPHISCVDRAVVLTCKSNRGKQNYKIMMTKQ